MLKNHKSLFEKLSTCGLLVVAYAVSQFLVVNGLASRKFSGLLVNICVYIILAISLNLVVGISGELSLGHAGFMCIGAFTGSVFSLVTQNSITNSLIRFPLAIIVGGLVAAVFGFLIGIPVLRLRGDYLAIVTLAFGEIIKNIVNNIYLAYDKSGVFITLNTQAATQYKISSDAATRVELIKGAQGITGTPRDSTFAICFIVTLITLIILLNLIDSKTGRNIKAARDNRIAAEAMGVNVTRTKMTAFVVASFFAGVAGVLYSHNLNVVQAKTFDYNLSILILVYVVLGGMRRMRGVMIAAVLLYVLPEYLRFLKDFRMLLYAVVLIAVMLLNNNQKFKLFLSKISGFFKGLFRRSDKKQVTAAGGKS